MAAMNTDITFTDEQAMLLETAVAFCRDKSPIRTVRNLLLDETGFDPAVWDEMVALGWTGMVLDGDALPDAPKKKKGLFAALR